MAKHLHRRRLKWLLIALTLLLAGVLYSAWSIRSYAGAYMTRPSDAAIVLGAAAWGDEPSPVFRERINHAVTLYNRGVVEKIIFTGGKREDADPAESEVARRYAISEGIPSADILTENKSRITEQNLFYAKAVARENGLRTFLIVSDPLHMKRSMLMARDLEMNALPSPTPTTRIRSTRSKVDFLSRETFYYILYVIARPFR